MPAPYLDQIGKVLTDIRARAEDGITLSDLTAATLDAMRLAIGVLDVVPGMTGKDKKSEVLALVGYVFDMYADAFVPFLLRPLWWFAKPSMRSLVLLLASGVVESLLPVVRSQCSSCS